MTVIRAAVPQLVALIVESCGWDHDDTESAVLAMTQANWSFDRILAETLRVARSDDGTPWDLRRAAASPVKRDDPAEDAWKRGAEFARQLLGIDDSDGEAGQ